MIVSVCGCKPAVANKTLMDYYKTHTRVRAGVLALKALQFHWLNTRFLGRCPAPPQTGFTHRNSRCPCCTVLADVAVEWHVVYLLSIARMQAHVPQFQASMQAGWTLWGRVRCLEHGGPLCHTGWGRGVGVECYCVPEMRHAWVFGLSSAGTA